MIKNIVFDIGNVLVVWSPQAIVAKIFPTLNIEDTVTKVFKSEIWKEFNRGKISEPEAIAYFQKDFGIPTHTLQTMMQEVRHSQSLIPGTSELVQRLRSCGFNLYLLSDNTTTIVTYLKKQYSVFKFFIGEIISCDVGTLKPDPQIYQALFDKFQIIPSESLFIDDLEHNISGAKHMGMDGIVFKSSEQCESELRQFVKF